LSFLLARDPRAPLAAIPPVGKPRSRFTPSRPRRYRIKVAMRLHHYRFLERAIVRVPIATLWQIGYTVNPLRRSNLTNATKREQYSTAPERARVRLGEEPCGVGVLGDGPYSARGRCHSDTLPATAWGDEGHEIIALIAEHYLDR